ncbi:MAG: hypothetical protein ABSG14_04855 [Verrucomicrobiia bacterium]|jgi:hypothetical protein
MKMYIAVGGSQKTTASMTAQSARELISRQRKPLREGGSVVAAALPATSGLRAPETGATIPELPGVALRLPRSD